MEMALDHLGERPLHVSYDIDAIDPGNTSLLNNAPSPQETPIFAI